MEQNLAQLINPIAQNPLTDPVVCQNPVPVGRRIFSNMELVEMFPEARRTLNDLIKEDETTLEIHRELMDTIKAELSSRVKMTDIDATAMLVFTIARRDYILHNKPWKDRPDNGFHILEMAQDRLDRNKRLLALYDFKNKKDKTNFDNFKIRVEKAKQVPIENFIQANRAGFAVCPFHNEKTPSFHIKRKKNTWHCFGCGENNRYDDVISFVMKMNNCDFKTAINKLT